MQVRDLIYLLQTRTKPEADIFFCTYILNKDNTFSRYRLDTDGMHFNSVCLIEKDEGEFVHIHINIDEILKEKGIIK